jgi:branched-subunit amino acid ABC-type transport system permease component
MLVTALLSGLVLGGTYALVAMGLTLQYGIARIMNLAYGEMIISASFLAYVLYAGAGINPVVGLLIAGTRRAWRSIPSSPPSACFSSFRACCSSFLARTSPATTT